MSTLMTRRRRLNKLLGISFSLLFFPYAFAETPAANGVWEKSFSLEFFSRYLNLSGSQFPVISPQSEKGLALSNLMARLKVQTQEQTGFELGFNPLAESQNQACRDFARLENDPRLLSYCEIPTLESAFGFFEPLTDLRLVVGTKPIHQGGFERLAPQNQNFLPNPYLDLHLPFKYSQPVIEVSYTQIISMQLTNDVTTQSTSKGAFTDENKQPAVLLQSLATLGWAQFLVQGGLYDLNKSYFYSVGVSGQTALVSGFLDWTDDNRRLKLKNDNVTHRLYERYQNLSLKLIIIEDYAVSPMLKITSFKVKQPNLDTLNLKDHQANTFGFDDNAFLWMIGARYRLDGEFPLEAYLCYFEIEGDFYDKAEDKNESRKWRGTLLGVSHHL